MLPRAVCLIERAAPLCMAGGTPLPRPPPLPPKLGRRLLFAVTTAGASSATGFRFRGGRL